MAREIRLSGIGDHFEQQVINTVRKATLKAEKDIKEFTPVDTGNLRESFDNKIESLWERFLQMSNMQSLLLMELTYRKVGETNTERVKIQLKVIQSLSQNNWNNIFQINLGVHNGCNRFKYSKINY